MLASHIWVLAGTEVCPNSLSILLLFIDSINTGKEEYLKLKEALLKKTALHFFHIYAHIFLLLMRICCFSEERSWIGFNSVLFDK